MFNITILNNLKTIAMKSDLQHKHAAVAIKNNKIISPYFCNSIRPNNLNNYNSQHSELAVLNYLILNISKKNNKPYVFCSRKNIKQCLLRNFK